MRRLPLGLLISVLLALVGCGGSGGGSGTPSTAASGPDPASVTPAAAAVYGELLVRPTGDVKRGVVAAARKVSRRRDPFGELRRLIDEHLRDRGASVARDIEPWLGARVGLFVLRPPRSGNADAAVVAAVRDRAALTAALTRLQGRGTLGKGGSYRGVAYHDLHPGVAVAPLGNVLVAGGMDAFRAAVDTFKGGPSLADSDRFRNAIEPIGDDRIAFVYVDPAALVANLDLSGPSDDFLLEPPGLRRLLSSLRDAEPLTLSLFAHPDQLALELVAGSDVLPHTDSTSGAVSLADLPGDAWLALATPPLGPLVKQVLDETGLHDRAATAVRRATGLDLDRDVLDPLGGLAAFARGTGPLDIGGGILLRMRDAASAQRLLTRLRAIAGSVGGGASARSLSGGGFELDVPRLPQPIVVLASGERIAAGYAAASAKDLLDPRTHFDDSAAGKAAIATLGEGYTPSLALIAPPLVELLRSLTEIEVADFSKALRYLEPYQSLALGTKRDGDRTTVRIVAALK